MKQKQQPQTSKGLLLMLGGYLYEPSDRSKKAIPKDSKRWKNDFTQFQKAFVGPKMKLYHEELPKISPTVDENMYLIKNFFAQSASSYVLLWSGHGIPETGDWDFGNEKAITLMQVLNLWYESVGYATDKLLLIIVNSCHSGEWITQLKKLTSSCSQGSRESKLRIALQAGCLGHEESFVESEGVIDQYGIGSLLIRKMVHDKQNENKLFVWTYAKQHPTYFLTPKAESYVRAKVCEVTGEKYVLLDALHCPFRVSTIENSWSVIKQGTQAVLNVKGRTPVIKTGKFTSDA
jgi:hypothetical protein